MVPPSLELNSKKKRQLIYCISLEEKLMFIPIDVYNLLCNHFHILKIEGGFVDMYSNIFCEAGMYQEGIEEALQLPPPPHQEFEQQQLRTINMYIYLE